MKRLLLLLRNKDYRFWVMARKGLLDKVPDDVYLSRMFEYKLNKKLNLDHPVSFNEKIQWLKINDRKSEYAIMVDKYRAKKYVGDIIGYEHIVPNYGVWNNFDEIDFSKLPKRFVLKTTHDSGGIVIVRNKDKFDKKKAKKKLNSSLKYKFYKTYREWAYSNVEPRIIAEKYLEQEDGSGLVDYKFFCFNGEPKMLYVSEGLENHDTAKISFFDLEGKRLPFYRSDYAQFNNDIQLPSTFDKMTEIATTLAKETKLPFVRIDLYDVNDTIYFSEITLYPNAGFIPFEPEEWDERLGELLKIE